MTPLVAIQKDFAKFANGREQSYSARWIEGLAKRGIPVRAIDVFAEDVLDDLASCSALLWRFNHSSREQAIARRLLTIAEDILGLPVFPDRRTRWHYDDKIAQAHLLRALGVPTPRTWVFFDETRALAFLRDADYPLVLKLASGASSQNVLLLSSFDEARDVTQRLFAAGVFPTSLRRLDVARRLRSAVKSVVRGEHLDPGTFWDLQKGYLLVQEFLPGNAFDTRVTVIGERAFAYRRFNRPDDFRASGSGIFDVDPAQVDPEALRVGIDLARRLGAQSVAIDLLRGTTGWLAVEISYTFVSWMVHECPGHWSLQGGGCAWKDGQVWPEDAILEDFLARMAT